MNRIYPWTPLLMGPLILFTMSCAMPCKNRAPAQWPETAGLAAARFETNALSRAEMQVLFPPQDGAPIRIRSQRGGYTLHYRLDELWSVQVGYSHKNGQRTNAFQNFPGGTPEDRLIGPLKLTRHGDSPTNVSIIPAPTKSL